MKKLHATLSILLALLLVFSLSACGGAPSAAPTPDSGEIGDITETPEVTLPPTQEPTATATPEPEAEPSVAPSPTAAPVATPAQSHSPAPTPTPAPTQKPQQTPAPTPAPTAEPTETPDGQVDLQSFYDTLSAAYDFSNMSDLDSASLEAFYPGLSAISSKQFIAKMPLITAVVSELILIECENASDVETVKTILYARKQAQADGGAWYPSSVETWGSARVVSSGNYVMLIAHESAGDMAASFEALFKK